MNVVISIGNTDNRLSQAEWSKFVNDVQRLILNRAKVHFFGGASTWEPWQNVAWVIEMPNHLVDVLLSDLTFIRQKYKQDSAWVLVGLGRNV